MAHGKLIFENVRTGEVKAAPVGFSWTTFFFGFFPALFRLDWKYAAVHFGAQLLMTLTSVVHFGLGNLVVWGMFCFMYNKLYIKDLVDAGWVIDRYQGDKTLEVAARDVGIDLVRFKKV
jgi:hypothetical protein